MTVLISNPLRWLGGKIDIKVEVETLSEGGGVWDIGEWDTAEWAVFDWQDITSYVESIHISRGQPKWESRFFAGSLTLILDNTSGLFTPEVSPNLDNVPWRPGRKIRVLAFPDPTDPFTSFPLFTGRIDDSNDFHEFAYFDITTKVHALDALGELGVFNPVALETATGVQSTDERVHAALDRLDWPVEQRVVQEGLHTMQTSYLAQTTLEECQRAAEAEGGALWADEHNRIVFKNRDWLLGGSETMSDYEALVLSLEPVAYWRMGDDTDRTVDSTGNGHTLTWSGSPTTGVDGVMDDDVAVTLDGINDYATVASDAALALKQDMSIEMWVKLEGPQPDNDLYIVYCGSTNDPLWAIGHSSTGLPGQFFFSPTSAAGQDWGMGEVVEFGEWNHVVVTLAWGESGRTYNAYINGVHTAGPAVFTYLPNPSSPTVNIGRRAGSGDRYFNGDISELAIYDKVLTPEQVLSLYQAKDTGSNSRSTEIQGYLGFPEVEQKFTQQEVDGYSPPAPFYVTWQYTPLEDGSYNWVEAADGLYMSMDVDEDEGEITFWDSDINPSLPFDPVLHRWQRLALTVEDMQWWTAPAEDGPWTLQYSVPHTTPLDDWSWVISVVADDEESPYSNFSVVEPPPGPTAHILSIKPSWDRHRIRNHITFARTGSAAYTAQDSDSQLLYGTLTYRRLDFQNNSDSEIEFLADRYLAARKDLRLRIDEVTIAANADPNNEDLNRLFYATQFGDLLAVNLDSGRGWGYERLGHVIGIEHNITAEDWEVTFVLDDAALAIAPPEE